MNTSQSEYAKEVYQQTSQLDTLLSSSGTSVAKPVLNMFESINGVADSPNTLESRKVFLESANNTVAQYNRLYDNLEVQYSSINNDITNTAKEISTLGNNLASLNKQIAAVTGAGVSSNANDLLDQRDQIVTKLSQYVDVSVVPSDNAMVNVYIGSGQSLVIGGTALQMLAVNGDPDPSRKELALSVNGNLAPIDGERLGGSVAGLFDTRKNDVERAFNQLGQNIIGLTHSINEQQKEGMTLDGEIGGNLFNDVNSPLAMQKRVLSHDDGLGKMQLSVRIDDLSELSPDEFDLVVEDYQAGPPEKLSFTATNRTTGERLTPLDVDMSESQRIEIPRAGISIGIDSIDPNNLPQVGKSFSLRPTRLAAHEAMVQITDPEKVAAADAEIKAVAAQTNTGNAQLRTSAIIDPSNALYMDADNPLNIEIISVDPASGAITYDVVDKNGATTLSGLSSNIDPFSGKATFAFAGVEVEMVAGSVQSGDSFSLNYNETGVGDNSNMLKIADLQNQKIMNGNKATIADVYSGMISEVGAKTANADTTMQTMEILQNQSFERMQSMSGVNMDEEAANLLQFQQHYSAAARVISVASELFDTILQASR